jgi:hypothetical protein
MPSAYHAGCATAARPQDQITAHLLAAEDLLTALATSTGLTYPEKDAVAALRVINGFLFEAAVAMASGTPIGASEVLEQHRWAIMKLIAFNRLLPEEAQTLPERWFKELGAPKRKTRGA